MGVPIALPQTVVTHCGIGADGFLLSGHPPYRSNGQNLEENMKKSLFLFGLLALAAGAAFAQSMVAEDMARGDALKDKWDHAGAVAAYMKVLEVEPNNYEALWKAGDQVTEVADKMPAGQKAAKQAEFQKAADLCKKAIQVNRSGSEGHLKLAVASGRLALFLGGKQKINMSKAIKAEVDTAIVLDPTDDISYHVLGRWHQNLANLSGVLRFFAKVLYGGVPPGSNDEAVSAFKKAIEIDPTYIEHYLELARTYQFMGKKDLMREPLEKLLALPSTEEDDPQYKKEAQEMLAKLK
jgi:tetratricopeptide (TPR) repeat protein